MSLRDNAQAVLERNRSRNQSATETKNSTQLSPCFDPTKVAHFPEISGDDRWNPELAAQGYHWCYDCRYFDQTCTHPDNPFRKQCPQAPRKCQWYEDNHLEYT